MFNVKNELCIGCGVCTKACPTGAISVKAGKAQINQSICIQCQRCAKACPRGAIKEDIPFSPAIGVLPRPFVRKRDAHISLRELKLSLLRLQKNVQTLNERLNRLENRWAKL